MKLSALALTLFMGATTFAFAHAPKIGEHGGPQTDAGGFHVEVVVKDKALDVYLHDHSFRPVASAGFKGVAIFKTADGKPVRIPLAPSGDNKLSGVSPSPLPTEPEGVVQITTQTGGVAQGRFAGGHGNGHEENAEHDHGH
jgi:hypothetical protein